MSAAGKLVLVGTPIGNLEDMAPRGLRVLATADVVACEDTRRTRKLLTHFGISVRALTVYNESNERRKAAGLMREISAGRTVALVSDAGMPGLSDPGYRLVHACAEAGLEVECVPGPSAAMTAVAISGLPPDRLAFEGFLPRKPGDRRRRIAAVAGEPRTLVFYESPHRIQAALADLAGGLGDRQAVVARELTKMHEEVRRGTLGELAQDVIDRPPKGEIVVVVAGAAQRSAEVEPSVLAERARHLMQRGVERREALSQVADEAGVSRRAVFDALIEARDDQD